MLSALDPLPQTVRPRKTGYTDYPVIAVRKGQVLSEDGLVTSVAAVDWRKLPRSIVVGVNIPMLTRQLHKRYGDDPLWQWKAADRSGTIGQIAIQMRTVVDYFGFRSENKKPSHFHTCIDATTFYANTYTLTNEQTDTLKGLLEWAIQIRTFCKENDLAVKSTASGIAAQFLRDPRFYPNPRRKVPAVINARIREELPGNHYQLCVSTRNKERRWQALEIDQTRAHHYHARTVPMPDADTLFAFGDFKQLRRDCHEGNPPNDFFGLYYLRLQRPLHRQQRGYCWNPLDRRGTEPVFERFVFSNELPMLLDQGYKVLSVVAGWGSNNRDKGIPAYARHCEHELDRYNNANWLKPLLLTTYGLLAVKPRIPSAVFAKANGEPFKLIAGGGYLHGILVSHTNGNEVEPGICNVLHRGMIEAATRMESVGFAEYLQLNSKVRVLQVYADSVIVEDDADCPLPFIPEPWRVKQILTDYQPVNEQAFVSVQKTRLPGVPKDPRGAHRVLPPVRARWEAGTGRKISEREQTERGMTLRRI